MPPELEPEQNTADPDDRLPPTFTVVRAAGHIASTTLSEDYQPTAEHREEFRREMQELSDLERQAWIESRDILIR